MEETFSIRIVDEDGDGIEDVTVYLDYAGITGDSDSEETDSDGWAEFTLHREFGVGHPKTISSVTANGVIVMSDSFTPDDGDTFSFTLA